jgi:hypothetical protein
MGFGRFKKWIMLVLTVLMFFATAQMAVAEDQEYSISGYSVTSRINYDGSADITDRIDFAFYGGFNNIMIPIAKNEGEEIDVRDVYIMRKDGFIECKRLLAGQWDAEVFTGTYSVIDEGEIVKLKLYGSFTKSYGSVIVHYTVKNAVKRYNDVAEYNRVHILKSLETRISDFSMSVYLPKNVKEEDVHHFLHGVFVGKHVFEDQRKISYYVPDTVPGEYVEARILFPEWVVSDYLITEEKDYLEEALQEELEYQKSDKADLLEARENAARKAGQKAYNDRLHQRARTIFTVISILLAVLGIYLLARIQRKIRLHKHEPLPATFRGIELFDPAEVKKLLSNGNMGAKAFLGNLLMLVSKGFLKLELTENQGKAYYSFRLTGKEGQEKISESDRALLSCIAAFSEDQEFLDSKRLLECTKSQEKAKVLKTTLDQWEARVREGFDMKNMLDNSIINYRNLGILAGSLLAFLGFVVPITLSIAPGFLMIPSGLSLLLFSLRIRKHTDFGVQQHRIWQAIRRRIRQKSIALDMLPEWMMPQEALLGFAVVLGTEKEVSEMVIQLTAQHPVDCRCTLCTVKEGTGSLTGESALYKVLKNTLSLYDEAISSVQDAI